MVTSFEYQLYPLGPVLAGLVGYPITQAPQVLRFFREYAETCPDELGLMAAMLTLPDGNTIVGVAGCYSGDDLDAGEKVLKPLRSFGSPVADQFQRMPYTAFQKALDWWAVPEQQHYWKSSFMRALRTFLWVSWLTLLPAGRRLVQESRWNSWHGAMQRAPADATAFAHRDARYNFLMLGRWDSPAHNETCLRWVSEFWDAMRPSLDPVSMELHERRRGRRTGARRLWGELRQAGEAKGNTTRRSSSELTRTFAGPKSPHRR